MDEWIALFRGINVGGNNILPMKALVAGMQGLGLQNVRTYIQSGNMLFQSDENQDALTGKTAAWTEENHGFRPKILLLSLGDMKAAAKANPYPAGEDDPKTLHFYFLAEPARAVDLKAMDALKSPTEAYRLTDSIFYLHAPDGIGRSKLAEKIERLLGVPATARNRRTVSKILEMAE